MNENKPIIKHYGIVKNYKLQFYNPQRYYANLRELNGREFENIIQEKKEDITLDQYGYYFGGILPTALQSNIFGGWTKDELDAYLSKKYLSKIVIKKIWNEIIEFRVTPSKTKISKKIFSEFIEKVLIHMEIEGIHVLSPQEYYLEKNKVKIEQTIAIIEKK